MRRLSRKLALAAGSLVLTLTLVELGLRVGGYTPLHHIGKGRELVMRPSTHPELAYELTPGASAEVWGVQVSINAAGYRGPEGVPGKFDGTRVLVLGDSIAFGNHLPVEATFAWQLQDLLKERGSYEVLNFAVGGYDILQEVARLRLQGLAYEPDVVVVAFCLNDAGSVSPNLGLIDAVRDRQSQPIFQLRLAHLVADRFEVREQAAWSADRNDLEVFRRQNAGKIAPIGADERTLKTLMKRVPRGYPGSWYREPERVGRIRHAFSELGALATKHDFRVVVVVIPFLVTAVKNYPLTEVHKIVEWEARRAGLDTVDVLDAFVRSGLEDRRLRARDPVHPDATGHLLVAKALRSHLLGLSREN